MKIAFQWRDFARTLSVVEALSLLFKLLFSNHRQARGSLPLCLNLIIILVKGHLSIIA
jgi:hypothetical protein